MNKYDKRKQPIPGNPIPPERWRKEPPSNEQIVERIELGNKSKWPGFDRIWIDELPKDHDPYKAIAAALFSTHYDMVTEDMRKAAKELWTALGYGAAIDESLILKLKQHEYYQAAAASMGGLGIMMYLQRCAVIARVPKAPAGKYKHKEAFCLMWYACVETPEEAEEIRNDPTKGKTRVLFGMGRRQSKGCGHKERIWNSRDGVTPFGDTCPSCGGMMNHVQWELDAYMPDYKPRRGQKIWRDGTFAEWQAALAKSYARQEWTEHFKDKDETYLYNLVQIEAQRCVDGGQPYSETVQ